MFHWTPRRIEAHVKLCVLALQIQRAAEMRCQQPWNRIAHALAALKAVRYRSEARTIVQRTKIASERKRGKNPGSGMRNYAGWPRHRMISGRGGTAGCPEMPRRLPR